MSIIYGTARSNAFSFKFYLQLRKSSAYLESVRSGKKRITESQELNSFLYQSLAGLELMSQYASVAFSEVGEMDECEYDLLSVIESLANDAFLLQRRISASNYLVG